LGQLRRGDLEAVNTHGVIGGPKMKLVAAMLATVAAVLAMAATAGAATINVQIRSTGFSPSSIALDHGDQVTWKNTDKVDHQVVADDGSL
jgi:plastocyanin